MNIAFTRAIRCCCLLLLPAMALTSYGEIQVQVKGLFPGSAAVLTINGKQRVLKVGRRSPEGVLLIAAEKKTALLEIEGQQVTLPMSTAISSHYSKPEKSVVRIQSGHGGHHFTPGRINGLAVNFLVDTGATFVSMNLPTAKKLGLNYRAGEQTRMSTANGITKAYLVTLDSVRIGDVEVRHVGATVHLGDFPAQILLGNSYLSRVEMSRDNGVLVLTSKY